MDRNATRFALWVLLGSLLLQAAWLLALPPFRGIDEFDHAYRAAAVARGGWVASGETSPEGRGELVVVPPGLVRDAAPVCDGLRYVGRHNCEPVRTLPDGRVVIASAASRYDPLFYWVIGTAARPFDGAAALYVMRVTNAILCSLTLAAAAWVTARWSRTVWPRLGLLAVMTPVTVYGGVVAAPNALEAVAALGVWVCLLGLRSASSEDRGRLLVLLGVFAVPLAVLRGLGPLWLAAAVGLAAVWLGWRRVTGLVREHRGASVGAAGACVVAAVAGAVWTLQVGSLALEDAPGRGSAWAATALSVPLWVLQSIAAFPLRNEAAPALVYATGALVLGALCVAGFLRASRRDRVVLLLTAAAALAVPVAVQVQTFPVAGALWQGRYGWPLAMGIVLMASAALDERPPRHRLAAAALLPAVVLWLVAHVVSVTDLVRDEQRLSPLAGDERWVTAPPWVVAVLATAGVLAWAVGALRPADPTDPRTTSTVQASKLWAASGKVPSSTSRA